jgi:hypothetical protein
MSKKKRRISSRRASTACRMADTISAAMVGLPVMRMIGGPGRTDRHPCRCGRILSSAGNSGRMACMPNECGLGRPSARGRPARRMNSAWGGLRPTVGLRRPRNVACVGEGRRLACSAWRGRFQSARRPSADGRPACRMNSAWGGLRPTVGLRRPEDCLLRRRRPTLGVQRLGRPILIGTEAFGRWSACAPNEFGLGGPSANGRPAPTGRIVFCVGEGRRFVEGRFQSARRP